MEPHIKLLIWTFVLGCSVFEGEQKSYDIDISSYNPVDESTHTHHEYIVISDEDVNGVDIVVSSNSTNQNGYYILQAHSFRFNISLSHHGDVIQRVNGSNVGLLQFFQGTFVNSFTIEKLTTKNFTTLMIAVTIYDDKAPIPGGCVRDQNIIPTLKVSDGPDIITVQAEAPSRNDHTCNDTWHDVKIEIYHKYLPSQAFSGLHYYDAIISMLSVEDVKSKGSLVATLEGYSNVKSFFSSYIGTGEVFAVLVYSNIMVSAYVPAISYGEDINYLIEKENKGTNGNDIFVILFSLLPFVSLMIIYRGHAFFHFTTFFLGLSCGTIISFFILSKEGATTVDHTFSISLLIGILYGTIWLGIWYKLGIPLLSATLAFLHAGALFTALIYHLGIADDVNFHNGAIYWTIFFGIVFMCWFSLSMFTMHGHILSCAFLGSYVFMVTTFNYWMGGNSQYVIINVYRRIFVPNFDVAILRPPFQPTDYFIAICGVLILLHGANKQIKNQRGKPPFPPHNTHRANDERSPLLGHF